MTGHRRAITLVVIAALVFALVTVASPAIAPARAAGPLAIDSIVWNGGPDATPGNGICADSAGRCTLRAALQEANALGGNVVVTVASAFAGGAIVVPDCTTTNYMVTTGVPTTTAAYFAITAPNIVLDLQNKISITSPDCNAAALYVNGASAAVQNLSGFFSGMFSFVVGSGGAGSQLANLTQVQTASYNAERSIVVANGANNVTVRASTFAGFSDPADAGAVVFVDAGATVTNLRVIGNTFTNDQSTTECSATNGRGCRYNAVLVGAGATVTGLVVQGNTFSNFDSGSRSPINLGTVSANIGGLDISGNSFVNTSSGNGSATISLPADSAMTGTNTISGNTLRANTGSPIAIYWRSNKTTDGGVRSNVAITDNYFNGYGTTAYPIVWAINTGSLPFERNTFGPNTVALTSLTAETAVANVVFANDGTSNSKMTTVSPNVINLIDNTNCKATFTVLAGAGTQPAGTPRYDVFWSAATGQGAEIYLGQATQVLATQYSIPYTSGTAGVLRIQTHGAARTAGSQTQSSQYSRTLAVGASTCKPTVSVEQAAGQADPATPRTVHFTVRSSTRLATTGAGSLQTSDFATTGSSAPGVTVTGVTALSASLYDVTATATDSGTIVLSLPAGAVADATSGATSVASTSADNSVTFQNPLTRSPAALTVYQGAPAEAYTVTRSLAVPPTSAIALALTPSNAFITTATSVSLSSGNATTAIPVASAANLGGTTRTATVSHVVTSADPNYNGLLLPAVAVTAALPATLTPASGPITGGQAVSFTIAYLPAVVTGIAFGGTAATFTGTGGALTATTPARPSPTGVNVTVDVTLAYANGAVVILPAAYTYVPQPTIAVTKTAFSDAARTVPVAVDADVLSGQQVYWTYTVRNTGQTPLTSVSVVDPQLPTTAYPGGVVCSMPTLAIGATSACTANAVVGP